MSDPESTTTVEPIPPNAEGAPAPAQQALGSATVPDVEKELDAALAKANENYDLYLRAKADCENIRRRSQDEIAKAHKFAIESFAESLVPVVDSLEKAIEVKDSMPEKMREGVELTLRQLRSAFERNGLSEVNPVGQKFDPHRPQSGRHCAAEGLGDRRPHPAAGASRDFEMILRTYRVETRAMARI